MSKYFSIDGFFNDDKSEFSGFIVKEFDDTETNPNLDDAIFFYGMSKKEIEEAIANPNENDEFTITSYKQIKFP